MGTRGFVGFVLDGTEKIAYVHSDAYPDGLGTDTLKWLTDAVADRDLLRTKVGDLRVVQQLRDEPTPEDVERLAPWTNLRVADRSTGSWYCLLRETQGDPAAMLAAGVIEDGSDFPKDSLFAEWGYVVDLDAGTFEAYEGFQKSAHTKGRFAGREGDDGYFPVALKASWPLNELPDRDAFLAVLDPDEDA